MSKAYFTIEAQDDGFWSIWYNNGSGVSYTLAENIGSMINAETMVNALDIKTIESHAIL
ncbi:hypothetical protein LCGC14_2261620 [marine sediment metagenome]|uniref:Uncharacterized protein n=1 Tax=marine sediment metagenome TaxID=412755 RepID=A0A0F9DLY3_9ZZZZ